MNEMKKMETSVKLSAAGLEWLRGKVDRLNRLNRGGERGSCSSITLSVRDHEFVKNARGKLQKFFDVSVSVSRESSADWELAAVLETVAEHNNIIRAVSSVSIPRVFRTVEMRCEHCHTARNRRETFVINNHKTGEFKQVGRDCLEYYLADVDTLLAYAQLIHEINYSIEKINETNQYDADTYYEIEDYLAYVAECMKKGGWVSQSQADKTFQSSTAELAKESKDKREQVSAESRETARKALDYARNNIDVEFANDYEFNLHLVSEKEFVSQRDLALAASIVQYYIRSKNEEASESEWIGVEGERAEFELTLEHVFDCESKWGIVHIHKFVNARKNKVTWFSSATKLETGHEYKVKATVKQHNMYKNVKETVITRVKVLEGIKTEVL